MGTHNKGDEDEDEEAACFLSFGPKASKEYVDNPSSNNGKT